MVSGDSDKIHRSGTKREMPHAQDTATHAIKCCRKGKNMGRPPGSKDKQKRKSRNSEQTTGTDVTRTSQTNLAAGVCLHFFCFALALCCLPLAQC